MYLGIIVCALVAFTILGLCRPDLVDYIFKKCKLPCSIRVHRVEGLGDDDWYDNKYPDSPHDPYRLNINVDIDGIVCKYHGRY
jgi:hypothetical protein